MIGERGLGPLAELGVVFGLQARVKFDGPSLQFDLDRIVKLGIRGEAWDGRVQYDLAAYAMEVEDEITSVANIGNRSFGLVVDQVVGQEEVVIKPLGAMLQGLPGLSGATITGDGNIALILDVPGLLRAYATRH